MSLRPAAPAASAAGEIAQSDIQCTLLRGDRTQYLKWWTRTQRIRTIAEVPIEAAIQDTDAPPIYQQIAPKAVQLQQLGMSDSAIAKRLGITDKTVAKAITWYGRLHRYPDG